MGYQENAAQVSPYGGQPSMPQQGLYNFSPKALFDLRGSFAFKVSKLTNGYTMTGINQEITYYPDIEALIRAFAFTIGGEDAVPVPIVSAEEAGLYTGERFELATDPDTYEKAIAEKVIQLKGLLLFSCSTDWKVTAEIDKVFKLLGFADYHNYNTMPEKLSSDLYERILETIEMRIAELSCKEPVQLESKGKGSSEERKVTPNG
jgi:hypothetical protein